MRRLYMTILIIFIATIMGTVVMATTGVTTTDDLNVRDGADISSNKIGTIDKNSKINIIEKEGNWYKIQYNNDIGYVIENYIQVNEDITDSETEKKPNESDEEVETSENSLSMGENQKLEKQTTLYILPLINSLKLSTLEAGTEISIISNNGKWLYVQTDKESGWISSDMHLAQAREQHKNETNKDENNTQENSVTNTLSNTAEEKNETSNNTTDETASKNETSETTSTEYPKTMYVSVNSANIRKSPSSTGEVISGTAKNESFKVVGKEGDWYKVNTQDGEGYIKSDLLSSSKS